MHADWLSRVGHRELVSLLLSPLLLAFREARLFACQCHGVHGSCPQCPARCSSAEHRMQPMMQSRGAQRCIIIIDFSCFCFLDESSRVRFSHAPRDERRPESRDVARLVTSDTGVSSHRITHTRRLTALYSLPRLVDWYCTHIFLDAHRGHRALHTPVQ